MAYFRDFGYNMFSRTNDKTKAGLSKCITDFEKDYFFLNPKSDTCKALSEHEIMSAILIIVNIYSCGSLYRNFRSIFGDSFHFRVRIRGKTIGYRKS